MFNMEMDQNEMKIEEKTKGKLYMWKEVKMIYCYKLPLSVAIYTLFIVWVKKNLIRLEPKYQ